MMMAMCRGTAKSPIPALRNGSDFDIPPFLTR
jgi:hypothetical protein